MPLNDELALLVAGAEQQLQDADLASLVQESEQALMRAPTDWIDRKAESIAFMEKPYRFAMERGRAKGVYDPRSATTDLDAIKAIEREDKALDEATQTFVDEFGGHAIEARQRIAERLGRQRQVWDKGLKTIGELDLIEDMDQAADEFVSRNEHLLQGTGRSRGAALGSQTPLGMITQPNEFRAGAGERELRAFTFDYAKSRGIPRSAVKDYLTRRAQLRGMASAHGYKDIDEFTGHWKRSIGGKDVQEYQKRVQEFEDKTKAGLKEVGAAVDLSKLFGDTQVGRGIAGGIESIVDAAAAYTEEGETAYRELTHKDILRDAPERLIPKGTVADVRQAADRREAKWEEESTWLGNRIRGMSRSITLMTIGAAAGGSAGAISLAAGVEGAEALSEAADAGVTGGKRLRYAGTQAAIEGGIAGIFRKFGYGGSESLVAGELARSTMRSLAREMLLKQIPAELIEENLTEFLHLYTRSVSKIDPNALNRENVLKVLRDTSAETFGVLGFGGSVQGATMYATAKADRVAADKDTAPVELLEQAPEVFEALAAEEVPSRRTWLEARKKAGKLVPPAPKEADRKKFADDLRDAAAEVDALAEQQEVSDAVQVEEEAVPEQEVAEEAQAPEEVVEPPPVVTPPVQDDLTRRRDKAVKELEGYGYKVTPREAQTDEERDAAEVMEANGLDYSFVDSEGSEYTGTHHQDAQTGKSFLLIPGRTKENALWHSVGHEVAHGIGLDLRLAVEQGTLDKEIAAWKDRNLALYEKRAGRKLTDAEIGKEVNASLVGRFMEDKAFRDAVRAKDPSLWQQVKDAILKIIGKAGSTWQPSSAAARQALAELRGETVKKTGRKPKPPAPEVAVAPKPKKKGRKRVPKPVVETQPPVVEPPAADVLAEKAAETAPAGETEARVGEPEGPAGALAAFEKKMGWEPLGVEPTGRKGTKKWKSYQDRLGIRQENKEWVRLQAEVDRARKAENQALGKGAAAKERAEGEAQAEKDLAKGEVTPEAVKYAPLHTLPKEAREMLTQGAEWLLDTTKSPEIRSALQKIIKDAGRDVGVEVENQKERILEKMAGERQEKGGHKQPWPEDPVAVLILAGPEAQSQTIDEAIASVDAGNYSHLAMRVERMLEEAAGHTEEEIEPTDPWAERVSPITPNEVKEALETMRALKDRPKGKTTYHQEQMFHGLKDLPGQQDLFDLDQGVAEKPTPPAKPKAKKTGRKPQPTPQEQLEKLQPEIVKIARALDTSKGKGRAEDLSQDAYLHVLEEVEKGKYDTTRPFAPWAKQTARNRMKSQLKGEKKTGELTTDPAVEGGQEAVEQGEEVAKTRRVLNLLTPEEKDILLRHENGETFKQIGESLGITVEGARKRHKAAQDKFAAKKAEQRPQHKPFGKEPTESDILGTGGYITIPSGGKVAAWLRSGLRRFFTAAGELPQDVYDRKVARDGQVAKELGRLRFIMGDFKRSIKKALSKRELTNDDVQAMNDVLRGKSPRTAVPLEVEENLQVMRDHIDALSRQLIASGAAQGDLVGIISENMGVYVTRSYRVFDDSKWREKVPTEVRNRAIAFLRQEFPDKSDEEIHGLVESLLFKGIEAGSPVALLKRTKLGSKDLTIFTKRKDIPEPIRELWGEYHDAGLNYTRSVFKMAHLWANHKFLGDVRQAGMGRYLFEEPVVNESGEFIAKIDPDESSAMKPLGGVYTTPEIKAAFERAYEQEHMPDWLRVYMGVNSTVKYAKTVLSAMTHVRNYVANIGFAVGNGHWRVGKQKEAWGGTLTGLVGRGSQFWRDYHLRAVELGLVGEDVRAGELRDAIQDASEVDIDQYLYDTEERQRRKIKQLAKKGLRVVTSLYQAEDGVWKLYAWENEKVRYRKARPDLSEQEVDVLAAQIVRDTYPTYSKVPEGVRKLRRFPLVGTFVNFPAEVIRTTFNTLNLARTELADPRTRAIGAQRLVGTGIALTGLSGLSYATMMLAGVSPDDDWDFRRFVAPWQKNSRFVYLGRKPDGQFRVIDLGYSDPHSLLIEPVVGFWRGENVGDGIKNAAKAFAEPFASREILFKAVTEYATNTKETGRPIYNEKDTLTQQAKETTGHFWKALEPGTVTSLRRIITGLKGEKSLTGRSYNPAVESLAVLTGQRIQDTDVEQSLSWRLRDFTHSLDRVHRIARDSMYRRGNVGADRVGADHNRMESRRKALFLDVSETIRAAVRLGVDRKHIETMLDVSGLTKPAQKSILEGDYVPYVSSPESISAMKQANPEEAQIRFDAMRESERKAWQAEGKLSELKEARVAHVKRVGLSVAIDVYSLTGETPAGAAERREAAGKAAHAIAKTDWDKINDERKDGALSTRQSTDEAVAFAKEVGMPVGDLTDVLMDKLVKKGYKPKTVGAWVGRLSHRMR